MFALLVCGFPCPGQTQCAPLDVCDTFQGGSSLAGSDCPSNAWQGPWEVEGVVERSPGRISLRRKDARIERAFAVNAAHENVFFSLQWGTEGSKKPDKASLLYSSNGGTSYNTLVTFDGKIDSEGDPLDTWTGLISLSQPPPDGFLHVAVEVTKKYNNKRRWFHVFSFRAESSCTGSAPETATPTSPPPSPAPSASPTSQPASCTGKGA